MSTKMNFLANVLKEKETNIDHSQNLYENAYCPTIKTSVMTWYQWKSGFWITMNWIEPINDENKLQVDEKNKNWKV